MSWRRREENIRRIFEAIGGIIATAYITEQIITRPERDEELEGVRKVYDSFIRGGMSADRAFFWALEYLQTKFGRTTEYWRLRLEDAIYQ